MSSARKIAANRRNAQRSTGPKTPQGKAAVRYNALKHGLLAKEVVITSGEGRENPAVFRDLLRALMEDLQPVGISEQLLVERIAVCQWRLRRAVRYETAEIRRSYGIPRSEDDGPRNSTLARSLLSGLSGLAPAPGGLATMLERTTGGIDELLELVRDAHFDVLAQGHLSKPLQQRLLTAFGAEADSVAVSCFMHNYPLLDHDEDDEDEAKFPQLLENPPSPEECKQRLIQTLMNEFERLKDLRQQVAKRQAAERELDQACLALPPEPATDRLLRYETAIERQLYKALAELERLQRRRGAERVLAAGAGMSSN